MPEIGQRVGDYEVLAQLGTGGMGCVYKVRNVISNRDEAMKILLPDFVSDPELGKRFMAEIRTLAGLDHPGIAQLRTAFQMGAQFVMVMEFVEGTTLEETAVRRKIAIEQLLDYSAQVLAALAYAHNRGVTHRDIKPANIMITSHGQVKLMDFGIAKSTNDVHLTRPGTTMGSLFYMSPEQVRGVGIDARSDLYSFGITLYEMLTGCKPFYADSSYSVLNAHLNQIPTPPIDVNPSIPRELNDIVLRAMAKRPEERFQTADEFCSALTVRCAATTTAITSVRSQTPAAQTASVPLPLAQAVEAESEGATTPPPSKVPLRVRPLPGVARRGLWIGVGAATATLALVGAIVLLPRVFPTLAGQKPAVLSPEAQPPVSAPANNPKPSPGTLAAHSASAAPSRHVPEMQTGRDAEPSVTPGSAPKDPGTARLVEEAPEVREARLRFENLQDRADSAMSGVQSLGRRQKAQGGGVPGDVLLARDRMLRFLGEARRALSERDLPTASEYMKRADTEITRLEKSLGR